MLKVNVFFIEVLLYMLFTLLYFNHIMGLVLGGLLGNMPVIYNIVYMGKLFLSSKK